MSTVRNLLKSKGTEVATASPDTTIFDAAVKMNEKKIGSLVIVKDDQIAGILTERDILNRVIVNNLDPKKTPVGEVMTSPVCVANLDTLTDELRLVMRERRIRHVPIVEEGKLCGMVSIGDLNYAKHVEQQLTIHYLEQYIYKP